MRTWIVLLLFVPAAAAHDMGVGFDPAADMFPEPAEVQAAIDAIATHPWATVHIVGTSVEGHPIRVVEITDPDGAVPVEDRVVTFIMTQQHGNEPAGTPAALRLLEEIDDGGEAAQLLARQVLLLMPQSNPDGSAVDQRHNAQDRDINRDHIGLETPEARAIHAVLARWDVHLAMDHHEYGGIGLGYPSSVRVYDYDITTMFPRHGNVREPTLELTLELNYEHIYPFVRDRGYTIGDYGVTTVGVDGGPRQDLQQTAGGPDPGILRNNYGLNNIVGLLVETFVSPDENPVYSFERRVGAHESVMDAVLQFGHANADRLIGTKRASEELNRQQPLTRYVEGETEALLTGAYRTSDDLTQLFTWHALPLGIAQEGDFVHNLDHGRSGLAAAILHPESSRAVTQATANEPVAAPAGYTLHPDYGPRPEHVMEAQPSDAEAPGPWAVMLLAPMVALAFLRRL